MLLTGFPGFIGRRLAKRLVDDGAGVIALVEPRMADAAREAAMDGLEVLEGDITERHLGLGDDDWDRLRKEVRSVFHLAAVYDLAVPFEIALKVNVDGTGNVLDLCLECENLERLNYVSTAYVAGDRTGVVYEHELVLGQGFKNHYESTKFQAEVWVRGSWTACPRPSTARRSWSATRRRARRRSSTAPTTCCGWWRRRGAAPPIPSSVGPRRRSTSCRWTSSSTP